MKEWTVLRSSEFSSSRQKYYADFQTRLAAYTSAPKGKSAKQLHRGIVLAENEFAYIQDNLQGIPVYSLIYKNWRCLYLVDAQKKTCIAVKIELMSDNLRNVEEDRHKHGKKLRSLR